jgi:Co/Zn/Cd efflux system component
LIAALSLLIVSAWLLSRGKPTRYTFIPAVSMLITTLGAFAWQLWGALTKKPSPDVFLAGVIVVLIALSLFILMETYRRCFSNSKIAATLRT